MLTVDKYIILKQFDIVNINYITRRVLSVLT